MLVAHESSQRAASQSGQDRYDALSPEPLLVRRCATLTIALATISQGLQTDFLSRFVTCESNVESYATTMFMCLCRQLAIRAARKSVCRSLHLA
jgi:hypothetical protein